MRRNMNGNPNFSRTPMREECSPSKPRDPHRFARSEERMRGIFHRIFIFGEYFGEDLLLVFSFEEEELLVRAPEHRKRHGDAIFDREGRSLPRAGSRGGGVDYALLLFQNRIDVAREERSNMSILAKPERHSINTVAHELIDSEVVVLNTFLKIERRIGEDDLVLGDFRILKKRFTDHLLITFLVIRWDVSLIHQKDRDLVPFDRFQLAESFVDRLWRGTAGESDNAFSFFFDRIEYCLFEFGRRTINEFGFGLDGDVLVFERRHENRISRSGRVETPATFNIFLIVNRVRSPKLTRASQAMHTYRTNTDSADPHLRRAHLHGRERRGKTEANAPRLPRKQPQPCKRQRAQRVSETCAAGFWCGSCGDGAGERIPKNRCPARICEWSLYGDGDQEKAFLSEMIEWKGEDCTNSFHLPIR